MEITNPLPDGDGNVSDFWRAHVLPDITLPPEDFIEIFHQNQVYEYNTTAVSFSLRNAPMRINFNVTARNQTDTKWTLNRAIKKTTDGKLFNVTRTDPNSWFKVTVFDKDNGNEIMEKEGFGGIYDQDPEKEIVIRKTGNFQVQMSGGYINADVSVKVPREFNT